MARTQSSPTHMVGATHVCRLVKTICPLGVVVSTPASLTALIFHFYFFYDVTITCPSFIKFLLMSYRHVLFTT